MNQLGISIYPEKTDKQEVLDYIEKASQYGFTRLFTNLLSIKGSKEETLNTFKETNEFAKSKGFEVFVDVNPMIFDSLGVSFTDLSFFTEMGVDGIRLDMGFSGLQESLMTFNKEKLLIEINMSNNTHYLDTIMDYQPNKKYLVGCHNFYPHGYTGLSLTFFKECTARFKKHGLRTAAFMTSQNKDTFGPWPVSQGLPTLEMHRYLPIDVQLKHFIALDTIDDVIISNCYPTAAELKAISEVDLDILSFKVKPIDGLSEIEDKIMFDELHINRGDISNNIIRSSMPRVKYKAHHFPVHNTPEMINRGDIVIESSEYGHYAGEMQIALIDMVNTGKSNVVGRIDENEIFLLDYLKPWSKFKLVKK